jgi:hypothetical protein
VTDPLRDCPTPSLDSPLPSHSQGYEDLSLCCYHPHHSRNHPPQIGAVMLSYFIRLKIEAINVAADTNISELWDFFDLINRHQNSHADVLCQPFEWPL